MTINIKGYDVLIDDEDFEKVSQYKWYVVQRKKGIISYITCTFHYEKKNGKRYKKTMKLHRFIMDCPKNKEIDHVNGNIFDNRKCNLRICTHVENMCNRKLNKNSRSGFKGVSRKRLDNKWVAQIAINYRKIYLGSFPTPELAYQAYCEAAKKYHGEFARFI